MVAFANLGWSFIHTKRMKTKARKSPSENWLSLTQDHLAEALEEYGRKHSYPGADNNPLGMEELWDGKWREWIK
jgi:hypothetical protein